MNQTIIPINYIERKPNSNKYRIVGKGITVEFLAGFIDDTEWDINRICQNYNLTPAEIYSAWAFYYDHKTEIDENREAIKTESEEHEESSLQQRQQLEIRQKPENN